MGVWLSIVSGTVKLLNYLAAALQQHHDEMNGRRAQTVDDLQASVKADHDAAQARSDVAGLTDTQLDDELQHGPGTGR